MSHVKRDESKGLSIFNRLLIAFLSAVIGISAMLIAVFYIFTKNSLEKKTMESVSRQFEDINHRFRFDLKDDIIKDLHVLASNPVLNEYLMSSKLEKEILARAAERLFLQSIYYSKNYQRVYFVDFSGKEKISVNRKGRIRTYRDLKQSKLFPQVEAGEADSIHMDGPYTDKSGNVFFSIGINKTDPDIGEFGGALIIDYSLKDFLEYLNSIVIFNTNPIWVFTPQGKVLKQPLNEKSFLDPRPYFAKELRESPIFMTLDKGMLMYQDFSIVTGNPLIRSSISIPSSLLLEDIRKALRFLSIVFLVSIAIISAIAFYLARYLSEPIVELAKASARLAKGDLSTQVSVKTTGEVQMLIDSFNQMASDLEQTTVSKEYVDNIISSLINTLIVASPDGKIISANPGTTTLLGYAETELIGQSVELVMDRDLFGEGSPAESIIKKGIIRNIETNYTAKDARKIPMFFSASVLRDINNIVQGIVCEAQDITERKQAAEEKKLLETQLLRAQKMEAIGTLAGGVAHDLNNILSGLVGYPELLLLDLPEDSPLRKPILTIQKSGEKAASIVNDLLTLARRGVAITEVVNLNQIVADYLKSPECKKLITYHAEVQIGTNLDKNLLNIFGSSVHLSKTIMNLVSNSVEAMPEGGTVLISTQNQYIDKPVGGYDNINEGDYVTLSVSDTGIGISSEDMELIFEPFYTKKVMGRSGTGLGMAVVWGTVKDHKGYINVQSVQNEGSTFTLYFPTTRKILAIDKPPTSIESYMGKGESILVIDDIEEQREVATGMLAKLGYSVTSVSSGEHAVDYLKNRSVNLLVLDVIMDPGIDGLETYKRILKLHPGQKAIIASGFSESDRVKEAQRLGAGSYIKKPYLLEKIGISVRTELDK